MTSQSTNRKAWAIMLTLLFHAVILLVLVYSQLNYRFPPDDRALTPIEQHELLFGGEYVMLGDMPLSMSSEAMQASAPESEAESPAPDDAAQENAGEANDVPKALVSTTEPSPVKAKKPTEAKGATKTEPSAADKQRAQEEAERQKINNRVQFGTSGTNGSGTAGSPGGSTTGARSGQPGIGGLSGYTLDSWGRPSSPSEGTITISVRVNARGKVTQAKYVSGSGAAASNPTVRRNCEQAALQSTFSVPKTASTEAVGTITWRFE